MGNFAKERVGQIVARNFRTSTVFTAHHIDFCCGGGITLEQACREKSADLDQVIQELESACSIREPVDYGLLDPGDLADTIVNVHHKYVSATIPALQSHLEKLCMVHGERHPELFQVRDVFDDAAAALINHMNKEELILFPSIREMSLSRRKGFPLPRPHFGSIDNPIEVLEDEHENEGARFKMIAELTSQYECPADGCQTYRVAYAMLKEFEQDLHKHIHLENNILFPAARELFKEIQFTDNN